MVIERKNRGVSHQQYSRKRLDEDAAKRPKGPIPHEEGSPDDEVVPESRARSSNLLDDEDTFIQGVFSTQSIFSPEGRNSGADKSYWYIEQTDENLYEVRKVNEDHLPYGSKRVIDQEEFLRRYRPEIEYFNLKVTPAMRRMNEAIERGDAFREQGNLFKAEAEYAQALDVDMGNVRALFGLGFVYLHRGDTSKARALFKSLVKMEAPFRKVHKHNFNDFGISLRKAEMYEEALEYYFRAVALANDDENLFFNIARAYFEKGEWKNCVKYLTTCLEMNRGVEEARRFCKHIIQMNENKQARMELGSPNMARAIAAEAETLLEKMREVAGVTDEEIAAIKSKVRGSVQRNVEQVRKEEEAKKLDLDNLVRKF